MKQFDAYLHQVAQLLECAKPLTEGLGETEFGFRLEPAGVGHLLRTAKNVSIAELPGAFDISLSCVRGTYPILSIRHNGPPLKKEEIFHCIEAAFGAVHVQTSKNGKGDWITIRSNAVPGRTLNIFFDKKRSGVTFSSLNFIDESEDSNKAK